jgi:DNA polymerase-3 subunit epsilon
MVRDAPTFVDVADDLYALFAGCVPVAHRLTQFDGRFLDAHFTWAGIETPGFTQGLCTWKLATQRLPLPNHKLEDCCTHLGIDLIGAHQALTDTTATARLLGHFVRTGGVSEARAIPAQPGGPVPSQRGMPVWYSRATATASSI